MKIVEETAHFWTVKCEEADCIVRINVPKRIKTPEGKTILADRPTQRWCVAHRPV